MDSYERAKRDLLYWSGVVIIAVAGFFLLNYLWNVATALIWYGCVCPLPIERLGAEPPYCYCPPPWETILGLTPQLIPAVILGALGLYMMSEAKSRSLSG